MSTRRGFTKSDLIWVLAYPAYQVIGTLRHEAAHALVVMLEGGEIERFVFLPTWGERFYWGYVQWTGTASWLVSAAPYLADLLTFGIFYVICMRVTFRRHWLWVNLCIIGCVSPFVNSAYRYISNFFRTGDLTRIAESLPPFVIHAFFLLTTLLYLIGLARLQGKGGHERGRDSSGILNVDS